MYHRPVYQILFARLKDPRKCLQVLAGPRQTGKTTLIHQAMDELKIPKHYASADEPTLQSRAWIEQQFEVGRLLTRESRKTGALLVLDELQKVAGGAEGVQC